MASEKKLAQGQQFGQWTLIGEHYLGKGGNGVVWKAHNSSDTVVALKFLHRHHFADVRFQRFRDEVEFLKRESVRAGILPLLDANVPGEATPDNRPWFATPLAVPFTKLDLMGPAKLPELVQKMEIVARTLAALHAEAKWHRDLKPDNLLMLNNMPVVGDFGLVSFPDKTPVTEATEIMGPLFYLAPEMMADTGGKPVGPADVYSLAKTLWVLASGQKYPLQGEQRMETPALRLSTYCPHPRAHFLDGLIERATRHDPLLRPSMAEFASELAAFLNTPEEPGGTFDFEALAKEYSAIFVTGNRALQRREEIIDEAQRILAWSEHISDKIAGLTYKVTGILPQVGPIYDLPERYQARVSSVSPQVSWRQANGVSTVTEQRNIVIHLQSFFQVEALEDESIRLVAGHHVQIELPRGHPIDAYQDSLIRETKAPAGSAQLDNEASALGAHLIKSLGEAVTIFAENVKTQHR